MSIIRKIGRGIARGCGLLLLAIAVYFGIAVLAAVFPSEGRPQLVAASDPPVYVCASWAHADIVMPLKDDLVDWSKHFSAAANTDLPPDSYLAFGWGDLLFFRDVPTWSDARLPVVLAALSGLHPTALRVVSISPPDDDPACLRVAVDRRGRQAFVTHILSTVHPDAPNNNFINETLSRYESFTQAKGTYSPFRTCNQWVADGLSAAGLPHAWFAPFSFNVMWPLGGPREDR